MNNLLNPDAIFSNNEMSLSDIEIYGFDYDYTLVFYSKHLHTLIFNAARDLLINEHRVRAGWVSSFPRHWTIAVNAPGLVSACTRHLGKCC